MNATRRWLFLAALNGLVAVAAGAYGWHSLEVSDTGLSDIFAIGVQYQMWHALALFAVAWLASRRQRPAIAVAVAGWAFVAGIVLFSGSLYAFGIIGSVVVPYAAPAGGIFLMAGWAALIRAAFGGGTTA